jgi:hypothetical protein
MLPVVPNFPSIVVDRRAYASWPTGGPRS